MRKTSGFRRNGRFRSLTKGQRAIVEHILLLAATFSMLVAITFLFGSLGSKISELQLKDGLNSLAEQASIAVVEAYEAGRQAVPGGQPPVRIILSGFPQSIAGSEYTITYLPSETSIVAVSKAERVKVRLPLAVPIEGALYSSFGQRPAVSYFSEAGYCTATAPPCIRLEMV